MQIIAEKILQIHETDSPESMNALGELYFGLAESSVVQNNKTLKQLFKESCPVVNHSQALEWFKLAEEKKSSALSEKGWLALGLKAYFAAKKEKYAKDKEAFFREADERLSIAARKCSKIIPATIIPATICANLGIWFFNNGQYEKARYWLALLRNAHKTQPVLDNVQYNIMQNYRAATIVHEETNFEHFCGDMIKKDIPFSEDLFIDFTDLILTKGSLDQNEMKILSWIYYKAESVSRLNTSDKKTISLKLARQYLDKQDWLMALYWARKNGDATLKKDVNDALDNSSSDWKLYLLPKYQIAAGMVLLLCGILASFTLNLNTIPQIAICGLVIPGVIASVFIIQYLRVIKRQCTAFLWGLGQLGGGVALLALLKPTDCLGASWQHILIAGIFSLAYFMMLLSMPEMFKFGDYIYKTMTDFFRWREDK